jgi:putative Mn2+ efflux pump MntP
MSFFEAILLSLALCVDTLVVSSATALRSKMSYRRGLLLALILGFCQFAFPLVGALIGDVARSFIEAVDHWIAFGLLAFIGGKMIWEGVKGAGDDDEMKTSVSRRSLIYGYFLLGVATSIDGLAVGIGLGLDNPMGDVLWIVTTIGVVTFIVAQIGVYLGKRNIPVPERTANIIAGLVLIGLGVKILLEHLL